VFAEALVMSTKSKRKHKRSDIEAKDRSETKTFLCVPEPKVERFYIPKNLEQNQNFLMWSNFFFSKSKTLLFNPKT
jgi:hypothetical protein